MIRTCGDDFFVKALQSDISDIYCKMYGSEEGGDIFLRKLAMIERRAIKKFESDNYIKQKE